MEPNTSIGNGRFSGWWFVVDKVVGGRSIDAGADNISRQSITFDSKFFKSTLGQRDVPVWDLGRFVLSRFLSVSEYKEVKGVIEHLEIVDDEIFEIVLQVVCGVKALSSKGEFVVNVDVDEDKAVIGVIGKRGKLFDEYFAGFIVVE